MLKVSQILGLLIGLQLMMLIAFILSSIISQHNDSAGHLKSSYQVLSDKFSVSITNDIAAVDIAGVKQKLSEFVAQREVSYARIYNVKGALLVSYTNSEINPAFFVGKDRMENFSVIHISSPIVNQFESVGRLEIGFPEYSGLSNNYVQSSASIVDEIILIAIFSFVLGVYLTNLNTKIDVRFSTFNSKIADKTANVN